MRYTEILLCAFVAGSAACSGDSSGPGDGAGPPASITQPAGSSAAGPVGADIPTPLTVRVLDAKGKAAPGVTVVWSVAAGGGAITPLSAVTNASGEAQAIWKLGTTVGAQSASATVGGLTPVVFTANASTGPAAQVQVVSGGDQLAVAGTELPGTLVFRVLDSYGNTITGQPVQFATVGGAGTLSRTTANTDVEGRAEVRLTAGEGLKRGELLRVTASVPGAAGAVTAAIDFYGRRQVLIFIRSTGTGTLLQYYRVVEFDWLDRTERYLTPAFDESGAATLSPDGSMLAYSHVNYTTKRIELVILDMATGVARSVYAPADRAITEPRWTPGGKRVLFHIAGLTDPDNPVPGTAALDLRTGMVETDIAGIPWTPGISQTGLLAYQLSFPTPLLPAAAEQSDLFVRDLSAAAPLRLTMTDSINESTPVFLTDRRIVFTCSAPVQRTSGLCAIDITGANRTALVSQGSRALYRPTVSRDGKVIAVGQLDSTDVYTQRFYNLYSVPATGGTLVPLPVNSRQNESFPDFGIVGWNPVLAGESVLARYPVARSSGTGTSELRARVQRTLNLVGGAAGQPGWSHAN